MTAVLFGGPIVSLIISAATSSVRESLGVANVALGLAVLVTVVGMIHWPAGLSTSIAAAAGLTYFHTEPVGSLRITSGADITMVVLLVSFGVGVSLWTAVRVRGEVRWRVHGHATRLSGEMFELLSEGCSVREVWERSIASSGAELSSLIAHLEFDPNPELPLIATSSTSGRANDLVIPEGGAAAEFADPRIRCRIVLTPTAGSGPVVARRSTIVNFIRQVEAQI
jgi:K+-sensing histidine kinase KdpD